MVASQSPAGTILPQHSISQPAGSIIISKDNTVMAQLPTRRFNVTSVLRCITFASYFWFWIISGAMYNGEPHRVSAKPWGIRDLANKSRKQSSVNDNLKYLAYYPSIFIFCLIKVTTDFNVCWPTQSAWVIFWNELELSIGCVRAKFDRLISFFKKNISIFSSQ